MLHRPQCQRQHRAKPERRASGTVRPCKGPQQIGAATQRHRRVMQSVVNYRLDDASI